MRVTPFSPPKREAAQWKHPHDPDIIRFLEFTVTFCFPGIFLEIFLGNHCTVRDTTKVPGKIETVSITSDSVRRISIKISNAKNTSGIDCFPVHSPG